MHLLQLLQQQLVSLRALSYLGKADRFHSLSPDSSRVLVERHVVCFWELRSFRRMLGLLREWESV